MTDHVATVHTPGYLPEDDEPPVFESAAEAWEWLAAELERTEQDTATFTEHLTGCQWGDAADFTDTVAQLREMDGPGTVRGDTPGMCLCPDEGRQSPTDLGKAYCVTEVEQ